MSRMSRMSRTHQKMNVGESFSWWYLAPVEKKKDKKMKDKKKKEKKADKEKVKKEKKVDKEKKPNKEKKANSPRPKGKKG